ncbi:MAG: YhdH/YhfP family quinone oxidoreductase [Bdellovibrionales bacterium]|nr:YhdH/YhfP family quinone oxidoreductase [Bdellovibrionales bacterium]
MSFKALKIFSEKPNDLKIVDLEISELTDGDVVIKSEFSSVNYKDALAVTGQGKILRQFPLIPGIDVSGEIVESSSAKFKVGDKVIVNGSGLGENRDGGFSEYVRVPADIVISLPSGLSTREAMTIGTAGFTAALCLKRMETNGQQPHQGPIIVTGASGGVGSIAVQILSKKGYEVVAVSSKDSSVEKLKKYGAKEVVKPENLNLGHRPLEKARWAGAIDNVGGELLSGIARHIDLWGNISCVGLADSPVLNTTVMPLILRGVSFLGASSANCPHSLRDEIWQDLGADWKPSYLNDIINSELSLDDITNYSEELLSRKKSGRALVKFQ